MTTAPVASRRLWTRSPGIFGEKELIARYAQPGPMGMRLGGEVAATMWEQLAWRRGIIKKRLHPPRRG